MITLKFEGKKYFIPNELKELTIYQYQEIQKIDKTDKFKFIVNFLGLFGIDDYIAKNVKASIVIQIMNSTNVMLNTTNVPLQKTFTIDGIEYGMDTLIDLRFDQFADLTELTETENLINDNLHIITAILFRPLTKWKKEKFKLLKLFKKRKLIYTIEEYNSKTVMERAEHFKQNLNMDIVLGLLFFFQI
jgi:hypothetical protein